MDGTEAAAPEDESWREARFRHSPSFVEILRELGCSLLVSTYQAGKLVAIGTDSQGLTFSFHTLDQAMGVAARPERVAVGAKGAIWFLRGSETLAARIEPAGRHDRAYLARGATVTGGIHCHEIAWGTDGDGEPELWVVNTLFSCLVGLHPDYSFVPRWRPPFISALAPEDRCHLNGIGMRGGRPAFVTVMAPSDTAGGWRADKNHTGLVLDVASGQPVTGGLAMPHSPRWHEGRLWVLDSGRGSLELVDPASGQRTTAARAPGFTRGLACHGNLAFVGLSRIRETAVFGGVPIAARHEELKCGIGVIDLTNGHTVATFEFETEIEEIFDVQVVPGARSVALGGDSGAAQRGEDIWVVPPEAGPAAPVATVASVEALLTRAQAAQQASRGPEAVDLLRRAAALRPDSAEILNRLGNALQDTNLQAEALEAYRTAARVDPAFAPAQQNLGYLLTSRGQVDAGVAHLRRAQAIAPSDLNRVLIATALPVIYESAEDLQARRARLESAVQELVDEGLRIDTTDTLVPTNFFAAYQGHDDRDLHANLGRIYSGPDLARTPPPRSRPRIGVVSALLREHTIGRLNLGRLERLDRERFELTVCAAGPTSDPLAQAVRHAADRYVALPRDVAGARRLIAEQELDLLLFTDVGMDALTYTLAFSRMAPVQCATWGHPVTTGSPAIDHFISSELLELPDADAHYTERLARLASLGTWYPRQVRPAGDERAALGIDADRHLYACPQTLFKLHPEFDAYLAEILRRDPRGVLVLIEGRFPRWTDLIKARFTRTMPDVIDRIRWTPALPRERFLGLLAAAEVVLDPIHFGGGNSSYEALAMGAPVVTQPGRLLRNRITHALYLRCGLTELSVDSREAYVELAVTLASDGSRGRHARERIAERSGVLFEADQEVRDLADFLAAALET